MSLADVKRAVTEKTQSEVDALLSAGKAEADRILAEARAHIDAAKQAHDLQTQELLGALERKEHAAASFAQKTLLLEEKRKAIDAVFTRTRERLAKQSGQARADLFGRVVAAVTNTQTQVATVKVNPQDAPAAQKAFPEATVQPDDSMAGGLIADDVTGSIRLDYSYDTILQIVGEQSLAELTEKLFGKP